MDRRMDMLTKIHTQRRFLHRWQHAQNHNGSIDSHHILHIYRVSKKVSVTPKILNNILANGKPFSAKLRNRQFISTHMYQIWGSLRFNELGVHLVHLLSLHVT